MDGRESEKTRELRSEVAVEKLGREEDYFELVEVKEELRRANRKIDQLVEQNNRFQSAENKNKKANNKMSSKTSISFYVTLPSKSSMDLYSNNCLSEFAVRLKEPIRLDIQYEVALVEFTYKHSWSLEVGIDLLNEELIF
ncbi:unnamed protein product [Brachionus calyciflorus]|uniref:Uncharacterized protein n=1 Tax=Brachionus calyciflorus TaxID=104777 RepID=A0A814EVQ3_9BILA|nr:unnamed protein product [Brachionus calyciflorus]